MSRPSKAGRIASRSERSARTVSIPGTSLRLRAVRCARGSRRARTAEPMRPLMPVTRMLRLTVLLAPFRTAGLATGSWSARRIGQRSSAHPAGPAAEWATADSLLESATAHLARDSRVRACRRPAKGHSVNRGSAPCRARARRGSLPPMPRSPERRKSMAGTTADQERRLDRGPRPGEGRSRLSAPRRRGVRGRHDRPCRQGPRGRGRADRRRRRHHGPARDDRSSSAWLHGDARQGLLRGPRLDSTCG